MPVLVGFIAGKSKYLPAESGEVLSQIIVKIALPSLILSTMLSNKSTVKLLNDGIWIFVFGIIFILLSGLIGWLVSKLLHLRDSKKNTYIVLSMIGNVIFVALPVLNSLYGEKGIIYESYVK